MPLAPTNSSRSSLVGRGSWGVLCEPEMQSKLFGDQFDLAMGTIVARREAMRKLDIHGLSGKVAGFSPEGNARLAIEIPYTAYLAAKAAYGTDVFQNRRKRALFVQEHPEYDMTIRR